MSESKKINLCSCMAFGGAFASVIFHVVFCGLPSLFGILGVVFGFYGALPFGNISNQTREIVLVISGVFIFISFLLYLKERCCINNAKMFKLKKIVLFSSMGLYFLGIVFHFVLLNLPNSHGCH